MEDFKNYTPTELLKMINDSKAEHEKIKQEIIDYTYQLDELEVVVNNKINELTAVEKLYIDLIEELTNRNNV
jgi:hypothetical protein